MYKTFGCNWVHPNCFQAVRVWYAYVTSIYFDKVSFTSIITSFVYFLYFVI